MPAMFTWPGISIFNEITMIGNRTAGQILGALFQRQHYVAIANMSRLYPKFAENTWRYLTGRGKYPYDVEVRTPLGIKSIHLDSHHDLLTVNEIFCREDYSATTELKHVVDIGSNIGISALYFLTRNHDSTCALYEPNPRNIEKLKSNLLGFESRYTLSQSAVSDQSGEVQLGIESTGRYGGIGLDTGESITVTCEHINDVLKKALKGRTHIDILKIDTEGVEIQSVEAISQELLDQISTIYIEARPSKDLHAASFSNDQYGSVRRLRKIG